MTARYFVTFSWCTCFFSFPQYLVHKVRSSPPSYSHTSYLKDHFMQFHLRRWTRTCLFTSVCCSCSLEPNKTFYFFLRTTAVRIKWHGEHYPKYWPLVAEERHRWKKEISCIETRKSDVWYFWFKIDFIRKHFAPSTWQYFTTNSNLVSQQLSFTLTFTGIVLLKWGPPPHTQTEL